MEMDPYFFAKAFSFLERSANSRVPNIELVEMSSVTVDLAN